MDDDTRSASARIDAIADRRGTPMGEFGPDPVTDEQRQRATALLTDLLAVSGRYGVELADWDWCTDLPGGCLDVIRAHDRKARRR